MLLNQLKLAPITKKRFKTYLRQLLAHAKRERLIKENYATSDFVFYTRDKNHKEIEAMDEEQAKIFFNTLINWPNIKEKTLLLTLLLTGSSILTNNIKPNSRNRVTFSYNEDSVLEINVKEGNSKPYYLTEKGPKPSGTYIRAGRSKRPAADDEILTMIIDSSGWLWEKDKSPNQNLTFTTAEIYFNSKHIEFGKENFLTLGIVDLNGNYTNLGYLISEECPIEIKFASYDEHLNFLKKKEFSGSIIKMADLY